MATVALLGMPVISRFEDSDGLVRLQSYARGATDKPRKDLEYLLTKSVPEIKVVDLGEPKLLTGKLAYDMLSSETVRLVRSAKVDVVLVIGGNHGAAFPLYHFPGHAVRADAHGDAYVLNSSLSSLWEINGGTYMFFVERQGLKKPGEVFNVGIQADMLGKQYYRGGAVGRLVSMAQLLNGSKPADVSFLDIDVDVLSWDYRLPHGHHTSDLKADDIAKLVISLLPKVVGLFECVEKYGTIPQNIVSAYQNVFGPICEAVAKAAIARSAANQQIPQASSAVYR